jgi:hypothetical protein
MHLFWFIVGVLSASVLLARWQFSQTRAVFQYLWYHRLKMRVRSRAFEVSLYRRYPRFMSLKFRVMRPYYLLKNHERMWLIREWIDKWWYRYATLFAPTCKIHKMPLNGGTCWACSMAEMAHRNKIKDPHKAAIAKALESSLSKRP